MKITTMVFDLDGTLLNSKHGIPLKTKQAIDLAKSKGIRIILASGRSFFNMVDFARELKVNHVISMNGSAIYSVPEEKLLFKKSLNQETVRQLHAFALDQKIDTIFYRKDETRIMKESPNYNIINFRNNTNDRVYEDAFSDDIYKVMLIMIDNKDKITEHYNKLKLDLNEQDVQITRSSPRCIELNASGISKASGLKILQKHIDIDFNSTVAFGDGGNDLEMLKLVGHPFVMGNCVPELQNTPFEKIGDNDSGALADKILDLISKGN